jgi:hypothetical protein
LSRGACETAVSTTLDLSCHNLCIDPGKNHTICSDHPPAYIFALKSILQARCIHSDHSLTCDYRPFCRAGLVRQLFRLHLTLSCQNLCIDPGKSHTVCSDHPLAYIFALKSILQARWIHSDHSLTCDYRPFCRVGLVRQLFRLHLTLSCHDLCIDPRKSHTVCSDHPPAYTFALKSILHARCIHSDHSLTCDYRPFCRVGLVRQLF